jgi:hypothetical protein
MTHQHPPPSGRQDTLNLSQPRPVGNPKIGRSGEDFEISLPVSLAVAVVAVTLDAGARAADTMVLSAGTHVPAQTMFAVVFASVLPRRGWFLGVAGGGSAYVACGDALTHLPAGLALASPVPALALAPRTMPDGRPRPAAHTRRRATALTSALAGLVRSLPCYLVFCLVIVLATPTLGLAAIGLAVPACVAAGHATWRGVPVAEQPAGAG